jgi:FKBP-type peptidyl-prolyl cis-trans isomerase
MSKGFRRFRALGLLVPAVLLVACGYADPTAKPPGPQATVAATTPTPVAGSDNFSDGANGKVVKFPDGLQYVNIKQGTGPRAQANETATVQYTLFLSNGQKLDSSRDAGGQPAQIPLSTSGGVLPGFVEGVTGMQVGGKRRITVPPNLGFTDANSRPPEIPANATLVFIVELTNVSAASPSPSAGASPAPSASPGG